MVLVAQRAARVVCVLLSAFRLGWPLCGAALVLWLGATGCRKEGTQQSSATRTNAAPAAPAATNSGSSGDYLGALARGQQSASKVASLVGIEQAIKMFQVQEGRFPKNLDELVGGDYLPRQPTPPQGMKFDYNPTTGQVRVVPRE